MDIFDQAVCFAVERHSGQTRKLSSAPYVLHPLEVAAIVGTMTDDKETLAACVLHDTVEDTDTTLEEITERFGKRVALLVMTETEDKRPDKPAAETWELRKEETLLILQNTKEIAVKMLWLGDKLSNMRSYARQYRLQGNDLWNTFHQKDPRRQLWYYNRITECLSELKDYPVYQEFIELKNYVFQDFIGEE
ncbi:MAG: bifunctional (p)ppGpp synthetase/guanosine-3',5'-bis(diphosphate) 3'-pyrophosphohydrolase [Clostridiales bacterium]|nr:bifunctional (p)ppGpp synthetase/guanosine-3',5'-bis(diphosphate) 3'-pyrophosphohydrolase [Candidatus Coliplasma caballi]